MAGTQCRFLTVIYLPDTSRPRDSDGVANPRGQESSCPPDWTGISYKLLPRLVDRQLVGLVEWLPNHCCGYHFFKQVVIQNNTSESNVVIDMEMFREITERDEPTGRQIVGRQTVERVKMCNASFSFRST